MFETSLEIGLTHNKINHKIQLIIIEFLADHCELRKHIMLVSVEVQGVGRFLQKEICCPPLFSHNLMLERDSVSL